MLIMFEICPFMSTSTQQIGCLKACALSYKGECAIAYIAKHLPQYPMSYDSNTSSERADCIPPLSPEKD